MWSTITHRIHAIAMQYTQLCSSFGLISPYKILLMQLDKIVFHQCICDRSSSETLSASLQSFRLYGIIRINQFPDAFSHLIFWIRRFIPVAYCRWSMLVPMPFQHRQSLAKIKFTQKLVLHIKLEKLVCLYWTLNPKSQTPHGYENYHNCVEHTHTHERACNSCCRSQTMQTLQPI